MFKNTILKWTSYLFILLSISGCYKKRPDLDLLREENASRDLDTLYSDSYDVEISCCPLTLEDIINIVLTNNLDLLAQEYELAVQEETALAEKMRMLPPLTLDGIFSSRSKNTASFTRFLVPPFPSNPVPQISSLRETRQWDIRETINLIDFGLAYFRSRQEKDKIFILDKQHTRVKQKLILDTIEAYWKAIAAQTSLIEAKEILIKSTKMQESFDRLMTMRAISQIQGLQNQGRIADAQLQIYAIEYQLNNAKTQLAGFMGIPPGTYFELADIALDHEEIQFCDIEILEEQALLNRPELAVKDLEEQIARENIRTAILQMFPNIALFGDYDADGNPFLIYRYWLSAGIRATWNLFNIPQQWHMKKAAEYLQGQAYQARLALSIAVMTQVHLAYFGYKDALAQYRLANKAYQIKKRLAESAEKEKTSGEFQAVDVLNYTSEALIAKIIALHAYSNLQLSIEQLDYAIGSPLFFSHLELKCVPEIEDILPEQQIEYNEVER